MDRKELTIISEIPLGRIEDEAALNALPRNLSVGLRVGEILTAAKSARQPEAPEMSQQEISELTLID